MRARGFSLVEAMVATTLAAVIIAPVTAAVVNINTTVIETRRRTELRSESKLIDEFLAASVQGVGGDVVRPFMSALVENGGAAAPPGERGCRNIVGLPACDGSDRLTQLFQDTSRPVCTVLGNSGVNLNVDASMGCCLDTGPGFVGQQALVVGSTGMSVSVFLNSRTGACSINAPPGLGAGVLPGTLASIGYPASLVVVSGRMLYVDRATHSLMSWRDSASPAGTATPAELTILADNVYDLQIAAGYDGVPEDGRVVDLDNDTDEFLFNDTADPKKPGAPGLFLNVREDQLRMLRLGIMIGVRSSTGGGNTALLLDGPARTAAGVFLESSSTRVSMRNINVFTQ